MSKRRFVGAAIVGLATVALAGGLIASNMGFKLNKTLIIAGQPVAGTGEPGSTSANGTQSLGLPFNRQVGMNNASQLKTDIGASCTSVAKLLRSNNSAFAYTAAARGAGSVDFALEEGIGYKVRVTNSLPQNIQYIVVGSDDPSYAVSLIVAGQAIPEGGNSANGTNEIAYKYHATSTTASQLKSEIGTSCTSVAKFLLSNNGLFSYTAAARGAGSIDFALVPGESYQVRVTGPINVPYIASHY